MATADTQPDVLVLGEHPATYLAATVLRDKSPVTVWHATVPGDSCPDHLVLINPAFFDLHKTLSLLRKKLALVPIHGIRFLASTPGEQSEYRKKTAVAYVASYAEVRDMMAKIAQDAGVVCHHPRQIEIHRIDEKGLEVSLEKVTGYPKSLVLGAALPTSQRRVLGLPEIWEPDVVHRYSYVRLKSDAAPDLGRRAIVPMSLDVEGHLSWAWLLPGPDYLQLSVEQPIDSVRETPAPKLISQWASTLASHGILKTDRIPHDAVTSINLPLAGALTHEGVANRTLLIGPAGGFYSACAEDIYPNCWSALFAADTLRKALKEEHLQDALNPYRHKWRTTLGDYLRGPQQNLKFLLPLVYRNQVMTDRLAEAILLGKSVVR